MKVKVKQTGTFEGIEEMQFATWYFKYYLLRITDKPTDKPIEYFEEQLKEHGYFEVDISWGHVEKKHFVEVI